MKLLHQQARQAIRETNPVWLEQIGEAYEELLTALPKAWAKYGADVYHEGLARSIDLISSSPVDDIARQLYLETQAAVASFDTELAERAVSNLYSLLLASAKLNAEAISRAALSLLVHGYQLAAATDDSKVREAVTEQVATYLLEFGQLTVYGLIKRSSENHFESRVRHGILIADSIASVVRAAVDAGRVTDVKDVLSSWNRGIEAWVGSADSDEGTEALKNLAERERELRIGLAFWGLREEVDRSISSSVLDYLAGLFPGTQDVLESTGQAIRRSLGARDWDEWVRAPRFGGGYSPAVDLDLLQGGLLLCLILLRDGNPLRLGDTEWVPSKLDASL
ncbi:MAG: hypothetical protein ACRD1T_05160, partial [Acidimicrobiia bacterium]